MPSSQNLSPYQKHALSFCSTHEENKEEGVWVNFLSEAKFREEFLGRGFWQNCPPEKVLSGRNLVLYFSLLNSLRSIKRKKEGACLMQRVPILVGGHVRSVLGTERRKSRAGPLECRTPFLMALPFRDTTSEWGCVQRGRGQMVWKFCKVCL